MKKGLHEMHDTAYRTGKDFFDIYLNETSKILEVGSQNVNGSLRDHSKSKDYTGLDFVKGLGVDIVLEDAYCYPFEDNTFDAIVTSSCFEHSEMFWVSFLECMRVLKPEGVLYCNAPSAFKSYHRYPVDCWRFMPDAGKGFETWAKYNNINSKVLETFIVIGPKTFDWCAIFIKDYSYMGKYPHRIMDISKSPIVNGFKFYTEKDNNWKLPINHNRMTHR